MVKSCEIYQQKPKIWNKQTFCTDVCADWSWALGSTESTCLTPSNRKWNIIHLSSGHGSNENRASESTRKNLWLVITFQWEVISHREISRRLRISQLPWRRRLEGCAHHIIAKGHALGRACMKMGSPQSVFLWSRYHIPIKIIHRCTPFPNKPV